MTQEEFLLLQKKEAQEKFVAFLQDDVNQKTKILTSIGEAINLIKSTEGEIDEVIVTMGFSVFKFKKTSKLVAYLKDKEKTTEELLEQRRQKLKLGKEQLETYENQFNAMMKKKLTPGGKASGPSVREGPKKSIDAR